MVASQIESDPEQIWLEHAKKLLEQLEPASDDALSPCLLASRTAISIERPMAGVSLPWEASTTAWDAAEKSSATRAKLRC